jgi:hypothetical protein
MPQVQKKVSPMPQPESPYSQALARSQASLNRMHNLIKASEMLLHTSQAFMQASVDLLYPDRPRPAPRLRRLAAPWLPPPYHFPYLPGVYSFRHHLTRQR